MEHRGERIETVVTDEDGNEKIEITWAHPPSISGSYYDDTITDAENVFLETEADAIIDFSDADPFSEGGNLLY